MIMTSRRSFNKQHLEIVFLSTLGLVAKKFLDDHRVRLPNHDVRDRVKDSIYFLFQQEEKLKYLHLLTSDLQCAISLTQSHTQVFIVEYLLPALEAHISAYLAIRDNMENNAAEIN